MQSKLIKDYDFPMSCMQVHVWETFSSLLISVLACILYDETLEDDRSTDTVHVNSDIYMEFSVY